jgi:hypothetical protein
MIIRSLQKNERLRPVERQARSAAAFDIHESGLDPLRRLAQMTAHVSDRTLGGHITDSLHCFLKRQTRSLEQRSIQATPACACSRKNQQSGKLAGDGPQALECGMHLEKQAYRSIVGR